MYGIKYPSMDLVTYDNLLAYVFMLLYTNNAKVVVYKSFILNFTSLSEIENGCPCLITGWHFSNCAL